MYNRQNPKTRIFVEGFVKNYITVEPGVKIKIQGYYGDKIEKELTIASIEENPLKITDITSTIEDKITCQLKKKDEKTYSLKLKTLPSGIKEDFRGKLTLKTNSNNKPALELFVSGKLLKEVKASPQYLYFGIINTSEEIDPKSLTRIVILSSVRKGNLDVKKIESKLDWISTEIDTEKKGETHQVVITLEKDKLPKGKFRERLTVHAEYNKRPVKYIVIIEGNVI